MKRQRGLRHRCRASDAASWWSKGTPSATRSESGRRGGVASSAALRRGMASGALALSPGCELSQSSHPRIETSGHSLRDSIWPWEREEQFLQQSSPPGPESRTLRRSQGVLMCGLGTKNPRCRTVSLSAEANQTASMSSSQVPCLPTRANCEQV